MHLAPSTRRILCACLAVPVAALITLAGCTMVGDRLTGLSITHVSPSACIRTCVETQTQAVHAEVALHQAQIEACQALPDSQRGECVAAESARHAAAMAGIAASRGECLGGCHNQGSGSAG
jgi:hypothetical protein